MYLFSFKLGEKTFYAKGKTVFDARKALYVTLEALGLLQFVKQVKVQGATKLA